MENAFVGRHSRALAAGNPAPPNPSSHWDSCKSPCLFPIAPQGPDMTWQRLLTSDWLSSLFNASGVNPSLTYTSGSAIAEPLEEFCNPGPARETATSSGWGTGKSWSPPELGHQQDFVPTAFYHPPASAQQECLELFGFFKNKGNSSKPRKGCYCLSWQSQEGGICQKYWDIFVPEENQTHSTRVEGGDLPVRAEKH